MTSAPPTEFHVPEQLALWSRRALAGGIAFSIISLIGAAVSPSDFFQSYLTAYLFYLGLALGPLALLMLHYLTGGSWGVVIRHPLESAMRTLPLMAGLFIPIGFGIPHLYHWSHPELVRADAVLQHRSVFLNFPFFLVRAGIYFVIWILLARLLSQWARPKEGGDREDRLIKLSAPGIVLYVFTLTFAAIDWGESLRDHWYSTMWGFLFVASQGITSTCLAILSLTLLTKTESMAGGTKHLHDLGKLLLMFVMLWAYFAYSQLLIVWSGNLPHEIDWYLPRLTTTWGWVGGALIVFQFMVPFLMLLFRSVKKNPVVLSIVAGLLLLMRWVDMLWVVLPDFYESGVQLHWLTFTLPLALGGIWVAAYLSELGRRPGLPTGVPQLEEALHHGQP